jgi:GLPGLI family protein
VFVLDSIKKVDHLHTTGYTFFTYRNTAGELFGKEIFMGKDVCFKGNEKELKWTITNEQKEISGYQCKKAYLEKYPKVIVWFTPEITVNGGPYIFHGLPGLVLESDSFFRLVSATTISYASKDEFQDKLGEIKGKVDHKKGATFYEIFAKKENFQRTLM